MNDNIIQLPVKPTRIIKKGPAPVETHADAHKAHKEANLKILHQVRTLIEEDKLEGLIVIGRQKGGNAFLTELAFDEKVIPLADLGAYVGVIEALKLEFVEDAQMAPMLQPDGTLLDPTEPIDD